MRQKLFTETSISPFDIHPECPEGFYTQSAETDGYLKAFESHFDDVSTLTQIHKITSEGVTSQIAYECLCQATDIIYERFGLPNPVSHFAAENHSSTSLYHHSQMSAEGIGETIHNAWEALVEMFRKVIAKISELWGQYMGTTKAFDAHLAKTTANLKSIKNRVKGDIEATFRSSSIASAIEYNGEIIIPQQLENTSRFIINYLKMADSFNTVLRDMLAAIKANDTQKQANILDGDVMRKIAAGANISVSDKEQVDTPDVKSFDITDLLMGNAVVKIHINTTEKKTTMKVLSKMMKDKNDGILEVAGLENLEKTVKGLAVVSAAIGKMKTGAVSDMNAALTTLNEIARAQKNTAEKVKREVASKKAQTAKKPKKGKKETPDEAAEQTAKAGEIQTEEGGKPHADDKAYLSTVKEVIKMVTNWGYLPAKVIIQGNYKVLSYVDKCLALYNADIKKGQKEEKDDEEE